MHLRAGLVLAVVFLLCGYLGVMAYHAAGLYGDLQAVRAEAARGNSSSLPEITSRLSAHMRALRWGVAPLFPVFDLLKWAPGVGHAAGQVEPLVMYAYYMTEAGDQALQGLAPLLDGQGMTADRPASERVTAVLVDHQAQFTSAQDAVARAANARARLDLGWIPGEMGDQLRELDRRFPLLQGGVGLLAQMAQLAGADSAKTYLVVVQNNDELRATGGFISAFGLLQVRQGNITRFEFQDSYAVDNFAAGYPPPPGPLSTYMLSGYWVPRDANWSPDFPTAARQIQALYSASTGVSVDGVIAIDQQALVWMLSALGPVQLDGIQEDVNANNVIAWMRRAWAPEEEAGLSAEWWAQRKDFIGRLGVAMKDRLLSLEDPADLAAVGMTTLQAVQAGHILLYFNQPAAQSALVQAGLDGAVQANDADFLLLVDSNIGFNKADALVERSLDYQVDLRAPQSPLAALQINYRSRAQAGTVCKHEAFYNLTYEGLQQRCYWDYWRVLAAGGSQLISGQAAVVPADQLLTRQGYDGRVEKALAEGGSSEFSGLMVLPAGETRRLALEWQLPARVIRQEGEGMIYTLRMQKQPGLLDLPLTLKVTAPQGMSFVPAPGWQAGPEPATWVWSGRVIEPLQFNLVFVKP